MRYQALIRSLERAINVILWEDRHRRKEDAVKEAKRLLGTDPPLHWEAWHRMKGWY